jgi:hypothetical protein
MLIEGHQIRRVPYFTSWLYLFWFVEAPQTVSRHPIVTTDEALIRRLPGPSLASSRDTRNQKYILLIFFGHRRFAQAVP